MQSFRAINGIRKHIFHQRRKELHSKIAIRSIDVSSYYNGQQYYKIRHTVFVLPLITRKFLHLFLFRQPWKKLPKWDQDEMGLSREIFPPIRVIFNFFSCTKEEVWQRNVFTHQCKMKPILQRARERGRFREFPKQTKFDGSQKTFQSMSQSLNNNIFESMQAFIFSLNRAEPRQLS